LLLSLYLLDIAGVDEKRIRISGKADKRLMFSATNRAKTTGIAKDMNIVVTSADASALIPFVAIAPQGFLDNRRAVAAWIDAWLEGVEQLEADVPAAARKVALIPNSPDTLSLVRHLGLIEFSGLRDNVRRAGLAGRNPVTLGQLFQLSWKLWREVDVLTTPAPENVPIAFEAISSLLLEDPGDEKLYEHKANFETEPLIRGDATSPESAALMAGIFARSSVRLGAQGSTARSKELIGDIATRYGLNPERLQARARLSKKDKKKSIVLEVYSAP
jgi:hypothetical protein